MNLDPDLAFVLQNAAQELAVTHTQHWTVMWKRFTIILMIMIHSETGNNQQSFFLPPPILSVCALFNRGTDLTQISGHLGSLLKAFTKNIAQCTMFFDVHHAAQMLM